MNSDKMLSKLHALETQNVQLSTTDPDLKKMSIDIIKVRKKAKIKNLCNQVPHRLGTPYGKVTKHI